MGIGILLDQFEGFLLVFGVVEIDAEGGPAGSDQVIVRADETWHDGFVCAVDDLGRIADMLFGVCGGADEDDLVAFDRDGLGPFLFLVERVDLAAGEDDVGS